MAAPVDGDGTGAKSGHLLHNLLLFGRLLRGLGLDVNTGRMIDLVEALDYIEIGRKADFYNAMRCLLVHDQGDIALFDQAFQLFWRQPGREWPTLDLSRLGRHSSAERPRLAAPPLRPRPVEPTNDEEAAPEEDEKPVLEVLQIYSRREMLRRKDFAELSAEEMAAVRELIARLTWELGQRRTRRQKPGPGQLLDFRRSLRRNLRYGGELLEWAHRQPKIKPRPMVVIADISGSMERYTRLLLHFVYGLHRGLTQSVEAFVFSTRLTRITRQLRDHEVERAMRQVSQMVPDWSGGTRIGEALLAFNFAWGRRVLSRGAVVLLISDGWDRGDPALLVQEMARLQRSSYRLIWLNPLLGSPDYEPLTRGMRAALPYVDDFLPVHNLASLESLADHLMTLESRRPQRKQRPTPLSHAAHGFGR